MALSSIEGKALQHSRWQNLLRKCHQAIASIERNVIMLYAVLRKAALPSLLLLTCTSLVMGCAGLLPTTQLAPTPIPSPPHYNAPGITVDSTTKYQTIDGFGISEAFGEAGLLHSLPSTVQRQILDDLFSTSSGVGLDMLRNMIPSTPDATIEPTDPGSPTAAPSYVWNGDDQGQVWLSQQLKQHYGVTQIYADAWSAPGFMKTNGSEANGGQLCGSPGAYCSSGDWRQAYANYLVHYLQDYQRAGITIPYVSFLNEPDLSTKYSSMLMSPQQVNDFIKVLGPTLQTAGLSSSTQIICCDTETWLTTKDDYVPAVANDPIASSYISIYSGHGYIHPPDSPVSAVGPGKRIWQSEWGTFEPWTTGWDQGHTAASYAGAGFTWTQQIYTALTAANVSAFFYWWGAANDPLNKNQELILINKNGSFDVSKRLWAFANYSRFVRPGATRIGATTANSYLLVTAFTNINGSIAIVILNTAYRAMTVPITVPTTIPNGTQVVPYITDTTHDTAQQNSVTVSNGIFPAVVPARALVTYNIEQR
jgi:glucuronoarabinoxylan endo-1,4-beta-xylanase